MDIKRFLISILTSLLIVLSCFTGIKASAEITPEEEILSYCVSNNYEQSIPYLPSWFQSLNGWTNAKSTWNDFISSSIYDNHIYVSYVSDSYKYVYLDIYNYDEITKTTGYSFTFSNVSFIHLQATYNSSTSSWSMCISRSGSGLSGNVGYIISNYSGSPSIYVSISCNNSNIILDDGTIYSDCSLDDTKKGTGIIQGLKNILTGKFSLVDVLFNTDASLVDNLNLLGNSFNGWLNDLIDVNIDNSSDEYNQLLLDLENNTQNSAYINNVSQDTLNQIRNTYQNLKNTFDNSVSVYSDNDNNYKYTTNSSSSFNDYMNDNSTEDNSSVVNNYFNTYIVDDGSNTGGGSFGNSGNGSCCNCNNSASATIGDIVINNNIPSGSGSGSGTSSDVSDIDLSAFEKMINQCKNYWLMVTNLINMLPVEISLSFASLITVVIICRILGR